MSKTDNKELQAVVAAAAKAGTVELRELKPEVEEMAAKIEKKITLDHKAVDKDGVLKPEFATGVYLEMLPEALPESVVKAVHEHDAKFTAASALAFGRKVQHVMERHKAVERVEGKLPMYGKNTLDLDYRRSREVTNPRTGDASTKYGVLGVGMTVHGAKDAGQLALVKKNLAALALAAFGGDTEAKS